jgi:oligopeptide transport system ATP-binding protein
MTADRLISLEKVTKRYASGPPWARRAVTALNAIDLAIGDGETLALVGESGSGKTTVGRLCLGLLEPSAGRVLLEGAAILGVARQAPWTLGRRSAASAMVAQSAPAHRHFGCRAAGSWRLYREA